MIGGYMKSINNGRQERIRRALFALSNAFINAGKWKLISLDTNKLRFDPKNMMACNESKWLWLNADEWRWQCLHERERYFASKQCQSHRTSSTEAWKIARHARRWLISYTKHRSVEQYVERNINFLIILMRAASNIVFITRKIFIFQWLAAVWLLVVVAKSRCKGEVVIYARSFNF